MANPILTNGLASPQSIYDEQAVSHIDQQQGAHASEHPVGSRAQLSDGRVYYYASNGAVALAAGATLGTVITTGLNIAATDNDIILTASSANMAAGVTDFALHEADVDTADIIANAYAEGYLYVEVSTGLGHTYKIRNHDSFDFGGTSTSKMVRLYDPVKVAAAATTGISFAKNPYSRVVTAPAVESQALLGVAPIAISASGAAPTDEGAAENTISTYHFWTQTWGPAAVAVDDTTILSGVSAVAGDTAGRLEADTATATELVQAVGLTSAAGAAGETILCDLRIRP